MAAVAACRMCGTELLTEARFCHGCGAPLAPTDSVAEYKQVTVLFADVVHSMDIATAVGPERMREIMAELVGRAAAVVQHYGGTVDKFTGDGIMAMFGAPAALEDHAVRACLTALDIQDEANRLGADVQRRDAVNLQLRVGLNSGQVIAGEIGSGAFGYTAIGDQVGMAQRMESVAPPGGVMLSESTARLVAAATVLGERQLVRVKGSADALPAQLLLAVSVRAGPGRSDTALVGRQWELGAVAAVLDRAIAGQGCVVGVAGPAGIGKSRLVYEAAALARVRGVEVFSTFCESHTTDVPFHAVARLFRNAVGIADLDEETARVRVSDQFSDAGTDDLLLLYDLMGIRDPDSAVPGIAPDARRRRLTALINSMSLSTSTPALYVVEDVHWIDAVSESMFVDLMGVIPQTHSVVLLTYRPEYRGPLSNLAGAQTLSLAPLSSSEVGTLLSELLGVDVSVQAIAGLVAERAAGNPFFAQEMVHELAGRGVLKGERGQYTCDIAVGEISVPATLQAAIAARIDRLGTDAKQTINAAAVIGSRFTPDLLNALGITPAVDELLGAELIDQVRFTPHTEYAFRHPMIRAVAYESQLKSARAQLHQRLAAAIETREPASADANAALIAEHVEAAGDLIAAYAWHMRAANWSINREIAAARVSWDRARAVADSLPAEYPNRLAMRIAPRTMLCATSWRGTPQPAGGTFQELCALCDEAGDKTSVAIAMTGVVAEHARHARMQEALELASKQMALIESIGDPGLMMGAGFSAIAIKAQHGEMAEALRWAQTTIDWAAGDPVKGIMIAGSPLPTALAIRGSARWWFGHAGWRDDFAAALEMACDADPQTLGFVTAWVFGTGILNGVQLVSDDVVSHLEHALRVAEASGDDTVLGSIKYVMGSMLVCRGDDADLQRRLQLIAEVRDMCRELRFPLSEVSPIEFLPAYEQARTGDAEGGLPQMRHSFTDMLQKGQFVYATGMAGFLIEVLLGRGSDGDLTEAQDVVDWIAALPGDDWVARDLMVLRLRAMVAKVRGTDSQYFDLRDRYRAWAQSLGFEGHMQWAAQMD